MNYKKLLRQAIDLHVHIGPEIIPRKFTLSELIACEAGKLRGIGVKNHFFPTAAMTKLPAQKGTPFVVNSVVLNHYVGGFNPDVIQASAELSEKPIIVWFPTLHTEQFLRSQEFEIPEEWIDQKMRGKLPLCPTKNIQALSIFDGNKKISKVVERVLRAIKECGAILATGHLSWRESYALVKCAFEVIGVEKIILTHPIYQKIDMPLAVQKLLAMQGAFIEHCYSMYAIDKIPMRRIARQIKFVGAQRCIMSSDVGQTFSKSPSEALQEFVSLLRKEGISVWEIKRMLVDNPAFLTS